MTARPAAGTGEHADASALETGAGNRDKHGNAVGAATVSRGPVTRTAGEPNRGKSKDMSTSLKLRRSTACPTCGADIEFVGRLMIGEVVGCQVCRKQLEVASADPLTVEPLSKVEEEEEDLDR